MSTVRNENGIALVTALLFTLISLGIMMALLTIVIQGTQVSAANKIYKNATEAGYGAVDLVTKDVFPAILSSAFDSTYQETMQNKVGMVLSSTNACLTQKMTTSTSSVNWSSCSTLATTPLPKEAPDLTFTLKAANDPTGFKIFTKIVDTKCGGDTSAGQPCTNSDTSGVDYLDAGGGVTAGSGSVTPQHKPAYFRLEVQSERAVNPSEKAQMSVLYGY
ncbi:pilus assembly protein PilX [Geomonas azotofigens]|uniref:pilus assembly protein PilX n=1 Tax=Geomonas azotofigens TaxID=2843196 RepID=UPI001C11A58D|nr:pilus assembly protein PilX [Geomonas azotofigens]MBU5613305.1 pilus assembly protein PilX [Geomonas azotofigens]